MGLLERSIVGGYYFDIANNQIEVKPISELNNESKDSIRSSLLFFIAALRYWRPQMEDEAWADAMEKSKIILTSLSAMEYKNTITIQSKKDETSKK